MSIFLKRYRDLLELIPSAFGIRGQLVSTDQRPDDPASLKAMHEIIIRWCVTNEFLILTKTGERYVPNLATSTMECRLRHYIYDLNLKRLCVSTLFKEALTIFEDTDYDRNMSRLMDLHLQIITEVDSGFVNLYVNKLVHVHTELYVNDDEVDLSWTKLLADYPYLWLLFPIQWIMRNASPLRVTES